MMLYLGHRQFWAILWRNTKLAARPWPEQYGHIWQLQPAVLMVSNDPKVLVWELWGLVMEAKDGLQCYLPSNYTNISIEEIHLIILVMQTPVHFLCLEVNQDVSGASWGLCISSLIIREIDVVWLSDYHHYQELPPGGVPRVKWSSIHPLRAWLPLSSEKVEWG